MEPNPLFLGVIPGFERGSPPFPFWVGREKDRLATFGIGIGDDEPGRKLLGLLRACRDRQ